MQSFFGSAREKINRNQLILVAILTVAAFFRFYRLNEIPPGLNNDEAFNLLDLLSVLQGQFSIFFPANTGREPLWFYLNLPSVAFFGVNAFALRLTAAVVGTATVGLVCGCAKTLFRSTRVAALSALFAAISVWHIFASRYGLRIILATLLTVLALWWLWRGLALSGRGEKSSWKSFAFAGLGTSLAIYTHTTSRLLPFVLIVVTLFAMLAHRARARDYLTGLVIAGVVALAVFLPLGGYFVTHFDQFIGHTENLSIFDPRVSKGNIPLALWNNTVSVAGAFLVMGDHQGYRDVPNRPVFDPFVGAFFVIGVIALLVALLTRRSTVEARLRAFLLAAWLAVFMISSITSDDAPNFLRMLPAMPAAMMLAAWGASEVWERFRGETARRVAAGAFGVMVVVSATLAFRDYFDFGTSGVAYLAFDTHVADAANWINANAATSQVYIAPLWSIQGTLRVLTRQLPIKAFESRDTVVLPSRSNGKDAVIVYPWEQEKKAQTLGERLGALGTRTNIVGTAGFPVALAYRVAASDLPDAQNPLVALARGGVFIQPQKTENAMWADRLELIGYSVEAADSPKRNLEVTLFIRAQKPMSEDYTFSIKVRDQKDRVWGQEDKWPGDNSYATTQMGDSELVIERFYPGLSACAPADAYHLTVEAYNPKTGAVLALSDRPGNAVPLGTWHADASQGNRLEDLEIDHNLETDVAPEMHLLGFTLTPNEMRAGGDFSLSLFWRGAGNGLPAHSTSIHLRDSAGRDFALTERQVALPMEGRGLCTLFDLRAPPDAAAGAATIFADNSKITTLNITR